eukprot:6186773-Pyramimonas_sp.AAC.1
MLCNRRGTIDVMSNLRGAIDGMQSTWCNVLRAIYVVQWTLCIRCATFALCNIWCVPCGAHLGCAVDLVQLRLCNICGAMYVAQSRWCDVCGERMPRNLCCVTCVVPSTLCNPLRLS